MTYFCLACWKEIEKGTNVCPWCGTDQESLSRESFTQRLIRALHHPEPETPIRAAYVLGELRVTEAGPELLKVIESSSDPYIAEACVKAIEKIGDPSALRALESLLGLERSVIVRRAAESAIRHLKEIGRE